MNWKSPEFDLQGKGYFTESPIFRGFLESASALNGALSSNFGLVALRMCCTEAENKCSNIPLKL